MGKRNKDGSEDLRSQSTTRNSQASCCEHSDCNLIGTWERAGISVISLSGRFDSSTPVGRKLLNLLLSLVEINTELSWEFDGEGRKGSKIGRPRVTDREGFDQRFGDILERLNGEDISRRQAAKELGIGHATLNRLLKSGYRPSETK